MSGRVLVVENATPYAEEVCRMLEGKGYTATAVPDQNTIQQARKTSPQYDQVVLDAVRSVLDKNRFDALIVNLHLNDDARDPRSEGDFLGVEVLKYVSENYPGICIIVCTAYVPPRSGFFFDDYNVADFVHKEGIPMKTDAICDAVEKVLVHGHPVRRRIDQRSYELKEVNRQIYRFLHNNGVMFQLFSGIEDYDGRLIKALGGDWPDERIVEATSLMADLWHLERGLPCYPLVDKLGEMEFGRAFWEGHRDHVVHHLLVYLLGLYLYYGSDKLRKSLSAEMSEEDFLRAWKIAALFHDLGYVFEAGYKERSEIYNRVVDELNDLRKRPLYHYYATRATPILEAEDNKIRNSAEIFVHEVNKEQIRSLSSFGDEDLFLCLEPQAQKAHLGESEDSLQRYWEYAMTHPTSDGKRQSYVDHGIASALVLLQQYRSLKHYIEKALPALQKSSRLVSNRTSTQIADASISVAEYQIVVEIAASAIALHYINVDNWNHNDAFVSQELTLNQYCLSLEETPFAFFLALVDTLQSWDRPKYAMPRGTDDVMQAQDISIGFTRDGKIVVTYKHDPYKCTPQSVFAKTLEQMSHYMRSDDLKTLLVEGQMSDD